MIEFSAVNSHLMNMPIENEQCRGQNRPRAVAGSSRVHTRLSLLRHTSSYVVMRTSGGRSHSYAHPNMPQSMVAIPLAFLAALAVSLPLSATAETLSGPVRVVDGDTLELGKERIRLYGIDAPETKQLCKNNTGKDYACGVPIPAYHYPYLYELCLFFLGSSCVSVVPKRCLHCHASETLCHTTGFTGATSKLRVLFLMLSALRFRKNGMPHNVPVMVVLSMLTAGEEARVALEKRVGGGAVKCEVKNKDIYGRNVSVCYGGPGGEDLNAWMVQQGEAVAYKEYSKKDVPLAQDAEAAKKVRSATNRDDSKRYMDTRLI